MNRVLVVDKDKQPLMPCHPARARALLRAGQARVLRRQPFTVMLTERAGGETQTVQLKLDPGANTTGMALVGHFQRGQRVIWAAELTHRGFAISRRLARRASQRRFRRSRHTRHRPARFLNRRRAPGWLPPSLQSRVQNISTWVARLRRWSPITALALESVKFDTQALQDPEISGVEYQQGTVAGYEVRQYLVEKWGRKCAYCSRENSPLEIEHLVPRCRGGSHRVSNLTLACRACNLDKGNRTAAEYGYPHLQAQAKAPLKDAAAVNATRWLLYERLLATGLPLEAGSGGRTQFNRTQQGYPKAHWLDAACVGVSGAHVYADPHSSPLRIRASGRQRRQMTLVDRFGFPRTHGKASRVVHGFQTGDLVRAVVPSGQRAGIHVGRVAVKANGQFTIGHIPDILWRHCRRLQAADGYEYQAGGSAPSSVA